jgi:hypothetical protein
MNSLNDIINKSNTVDYSDMAIPQCFNRWCISNLPASHCIPIHPGSINYVRVCDNCYYDFAFEGISIYSWTDEQLWSRNMSEEELMRLYRKLNRYDNE